MRQAEAPVSGLGIAVATGVPQTAAFGRRPRLNDQQIQTFIGFSTVPEGCRGNARGKQPGPGRRPPSACESFLRKPALVAALAGSLPASQQSADDRQAQSATKIFGSMVNGLFCDD
jgi:hypothetical protein